MGRFSGNIGFVETVENPINSGIWSNNTTVRRYTGDIIQKSLSWIPNTESVNDSLSTNTIISIIADSYALNNLHRLKYVELYNVKWEVVSFKIQRPRIDITIGGVYNG